MLRLGSWGFYLAMDSLFRNFYGNMKGAFKSQVQRDLNGEIGAIIIGVKLQLFGSPRLRSKCRHASTIGGPIAPQIRKLLILTT